MEAASDTQSAHSGFTSGTNPYQQSELSMRQLARVDDYSRNILQAQSMLANITESQRVLHSVSKDFSAIYNSSEDKILEVKRYYDEQLRESEAMLNNRPTKQILDKVNKCEDEMIDIELQIEISERKLQMLREKADTEDEVKDVGVEQSQEVKEKLMQLEKEPEQTSSVVEQVENDTREFNKLQEEVEISKAEDRKRMLENIEYRKLERDQEQTDEIESIKNYVAEEENPQNESSQDAEQLALHEKFFKEVEAVGQE